MSKKYQELKKYQDELDEEELACPKCKKTTYWVEMRSFGTCLDCYYQFNKKNNE